MHSPEAFKSLRETDKLNHLTCNLHCMSTGRMREITMTEAVGKCSTVAC